jgi:hypothetical protein
MMTAKVSGMITDSNSGEVTQIRYAEMLHDWTTTKLLAKLAAVRSQLSNAHLGSFADECNLTDFGMGITTELRRRGVEYPA